MKYLSKKFLIIILVALTALTVRIASFSLWKNSPFTEYSKIQGLDMKTHLEFAKNFAGGDSAFSLYKALCLAAMKFKNSDYPIELIVLFQHICGILSCILVTLICFRLSHNKILALNAGISAALYAPLLLYESFTLVETLFVFSCLIALYTCIRAGARKVSSIFAAGFFLILPSTVRFSGIFLSSALFLWFLLRLIRKKELSDNRKFLKVFAIFASGSLSAVFSVLLINYFNTGHFMFLPGKPVVSYVLKAGLEMKINPEEDIAFVETESYSLERKTAGYLAKFFDIVKPFEIPNNLNYYFIKNQLPIMDFIIGPLLLIPLALSGFIALLSRPYLLRRYSVLLFYFISIGMPMIVFIPLSRYRIALIPVFAFFAGFFIVSVIKYLRISQSKPLPLLLSLLLYIIVLSYTAPKDFPLRSEDFVSYGQALEGKKPDSEDILFAYIKGYELSPESQSAVSHLANYLMSKNRFMEAKVILEDFLKKSNDNRAKILYAASLLGISEFEKAKDVLERIPEPETKRAKVNYYYQLAEAYRLLDNCEKASEYYRLALKFAETDSQKTTIKSGLEKIGVHLPSP